MSLQGGKGGYEKFVRDGFNLANGAKHGLWAIRDAPAWRMQFTSKDWE